MLTKRIIPCLDVEGGSVVKGTSFVRLKYAGDPATLARRYYEEGADELVFLDITASYEKRKIMIDVVRKVAEQVFIPFAVGGGIRTIGDIRALLHAGADKVSINTAAVENPGLLRKAAATFGSQCIIVAVDAKRSGNRWEVFVKGGREPTGKDALAWAKEAVRMGAGEILLTSMDKDGTKEGYDIDLTKSMAEIVNVPIIASGGAGSLESIANVLKEGKADAALAASIFHYGKYSISQVKEYLKNRGIEVRM